MKFSDYIQQNPPTEEALKQAAEEKAKEQELQEAARKAREEAEAEKKRKKKEELSKDERAAAAKLYKDLQRELLEGASPAQLLYKSLQIMGILLRVPKADLDKQRERLEVIQGHVLGDMGVCGAELAEVENRLSLLDAALADSSTTFEQRQIIRRSINMNKKRLKLLREQAKNDEDTLF